MRQHNDGSLMAGLEVWIPPVHQQGIGHRSLRARRGLPRLVAIAVGMNALAGEGIASSEQLGVLAPQVTRLPLMPGQCGSLKVFAATDRFVMNDLHKGGHDH